jgi:hypothetical protein
VPPDPRLESHLLIAAIALGIAAVLVRASYLEWANQRHGLHRSGLPTERLIRINHPHIDRESNVLLPFAGLVPGSLPIRVPAVSPIPEAAWRNARRISRFGRRLDDGAAR